ncbi:hypothetical protein D7V95_01770 [bacterium J10(2018)]|nr:hypothetical protein D7V95_01770 [bacterium J10(2018)]
MKWPVFIIFGIMSFLPTNAQTTMDKLIGKDWELQFSSGNHPSEGIHFTETESLYFTYYYGRRETTTPYYLSDTIDKVFDNSKIGKSKNGKYIIANPRFRPTPNDPWKRLTVVFKIIVLNDTVLQIVDINNPRYPKTLKIRQEE